MVEGYVHEGGWARLQDWDQASGPERQEASVCSRIQQNRWPSSCPRGRRWPRLASQHLQAGRALGEMFIATPASSPGFADQPY